MQTFMYVVGPFLLQAGAGLGATIAAIGWVALRGIPGYKERAARRKQDAEEAEMRQRKARAQWYAADAQQLICDVVMREDALLPEDMIARATKLATTSIDSYNPQKELL